MLKSKLNKLLTNLALASGLALASSPALSQDEDALVVVSSGGTFYDAMRSNFFDPFTQETGIEIDHVASSVADQFVKVRAMMRVGDVEWDVVTVQPGTAIRDADLLEQLDCSRIPNAEKFGVKNACSGNTLLRTLGGGVIAYNTDVFPEEGPQTWADYWDVKRFPGPRCLPGIKPEWMIMIALMADGVAPDKLFPLDIERGIKKLEELKPNVAVWWESGNESQNLLRQGECVMSWMWSGRALQLVKEGQPITVSWKQHLPIIAAWGILKDSKNKDSAYKFLNYFMTRPDAHLKLSDALFYDTSNRIAVEKLDENTKKLRATAAENLAEQVPTDFKWIADHSDEMRRAFNDMLTR